jgi:hypothetical protein
MRMWVQGDTSNGKYNWGISTRAVPLDDRYQILADKDSDEYNTLNYECSMKNAMSALDRS